MAAPAGLTPGSSPARHRTPDHPHDAKDPVMLKRLLPMAGHTRGNRSAVTCELKCGNACAHPVPNTSANPTFQQIAETAISRRSALVGGTGLAAAVVIGSQVAQAPEALADNGRRPTGGGKLPFEPIAPVSRTVDTMTVPEGYDWGTVIRWGDPLFADSPEFDIEHQTGASQAAQFGYNNDYLNIITDGGNDRSGYLVSNHEYTNENIMFSPEYIASNFEDVVNVGLQAHGLSIVDLKRAKRGAPWEYVRGGRRNRRITGTTEFEVRGPAAGHALLKTVEDPTGTRVLVVDDSPTTLALLRKMLAQNGYIVIEAANVEQAIERIGRAGARHVKKGVKQTRCLGGRRVDRQVRGRHIERHRRQQHRITPTVCWTLCEALYIYDLIESTWTPREADTIMNPHFPDE